MERKIMEFEDWCVNQSCTDCIYEKEKDFASCEIAYYKDCENNVTGKPDKKHHVYIASPFFNPAQVERVEAVEKLLDKLGLTYFSPRKDSACGNIHDPEVRKRVFKLNEDNILAAEQVIAITDDKDVGTMVEVGMAHKKVPIIGVALTLRDDQLFNLMIAEACTSVVRNMEQLEEVLTTGKNIKYTGLIE